VPTRLRSIRLLEPLGHRNYALLTAGAVVSLLGDGFFNVALAWQVYELSNLPTALSIVGIAWTLPLVAFVLIGGVFSDRYDRRCLMIGADGLIVVVGLGDAFFNPASSAIVPSLLPEAQLPQANALNALYRPLMVRLIGPAVGGIVIGLAGAGTAFVVDAGSFVLSALLVAAITSRPVRTVTAHGLRQTLAEMAEGFRFVRRNPWLWATLLAAMFSLLVFVGPMSVLLPFLVKNQLGLGADSLGLVYALSGVGSIVSALLVGQLGVPRRRVTAMYLSWSIGVALLAGYGVMTTLWQALVIGFLVQAFFEVGQIIWTTLLQTLVPRDLLGRVTSLDWLVSTGLVPVSFALTGPVAGALGASTTMIVAGLVGAFFMGILLFVPGVRDPERVVARA